MITIHSAWHSMFAHFGMAFPASVSLLIIAGFVVKLFGNGNFARKLSYPIYVMSFLSLFALIVACVTAFIDFPTATFIASPWFRFKLALAIITFFIYAAIYYMFLIKGQEVWSEGTSATYVLILSIIGGLALSLLGSAGGYMACGHSVLGFALKYLGLPMPRG